MPTGRNGDCDDRYATLIARIKESLRMIEQVNERIPPGPVNVKLPKVVRAPEGHAYVRTEAPLGQLSYYMVSHGERPRGGSRCARRRSTTSSLPYLLKEPSCPT